MLTPYEINSLPCVLKNVNADVYWPRPSVSDCSYPHCHTTARMWMKLWELQGVSSPLVVHYRVDLQMVHGFWCYDNIAPNVKFQRVTVLVLILWLILKVIHPLQFARPLKCGFAYRSPAADKLSTDRASHSPCAC